MTPREDFALELVEDGLLGALEAHRLLQRTADWADSELLWLLLTYVVFTAAERESLPAAFKAGASLHELMALGVHGLNAAGEDLAVIDDAELRQRQKVAERLRQISTPSGWLTTYVGLLVAESRRRRGAHVSGRTRTDS